MQAPLGMVGPKKLARREAATNFKENISGTYLPGVSMSPHLASGRGRGVRSGGQIAHATDQWGGASRNRYYTPGQGGDLVSYGVGEAASKFDLNRSRYSRLKGTTQKYKSIDRNLYAGDLGSKVMVGLNGSGVQRAANSLASGSFISPGLEHLTRNINPLGKLGGYFASKAGMNPDAQDAIDARAQEALHRMSRWHKIMKVLNAADVKAGYESLDSKFVRGPVAPKMFRPVVHRPHTAYSA